MWGSYGQVKGYCELNQFLVFTISLSERPRFLFPSHCGLSRRKWLLCHLAELTQWTRPKCQEGHSSRPLAVVICADEMIFSLIWMRKGGSLRLRQPWRLVPKRHEIMWDVGKTYSKVKDVFRVLIFYGAYSHFMFGVFLVYLEPFLNSMRNVFLAYC